MTELSPVVVRWLPVVGFESLYEVSDQGQVRNARTEQLLALTIRGHGYAYANLWSENRQRLFAVHRLVAAAFLGPAPAGARNVLHRDGSKTNNCPTNLRYGSQSANMTDRAKHGGYKLKTADVLAIRASTLPSRAAAKVFGCSPPHILRIRSGKAWAHV